MYPTQEILRRLASLEAQTSGAPASDASVDAVQTVTSTALTTSTTVVTSDPVALRAGQKVVILASADAVQGGSVSAVAVKWQVRLVAAPGLITVPHSVGPELTSLPVAQTDHFPMNAIGYYVAPAAGNYTFELDAFQGIGSPFTFSDNSMVVIAP